MAQIEYNINFYLTLWQTLVCIFTFTIMVMSIRRTKQKKTDVASKLSIAFIFFFIANLFQVLGSWNGIIPYLIIENNKSFSGVFLSQMVNYQFAYAFLVLGMYFIYRFSVLLSRPDNSEKKPIDYIAIIGSIFIFIYGFVRIWTDNIPPSNEIIEILRSVDIYVVILSLIMIFPMLKTSITLMVRLEKDNEDRNRIKYMLSLSIFLLLLILSFVLEAVYGIMTGEFTNIFSFIAWVCVVVALLSAYLSFYKKKPDNSR